MAKIARRRALAFIIISSCFHFLVGPVSCYPTRPNPGFNCGWTKEESGTISYYKQRCRAFGNSQVGFTYETWYRPSSTLTLTCEGAEPYRHEMLRYYDMADFESFMFVRCPIPALPFSELLLNLRVRNLYFNSHSISSINPTVFRNLSHLARLDLSNNLFRSLPYNFFSGFPNLEHISLSFNKLSSLPETIFHGLKLITLDLADNELEALSDATFVNQTEIKTLGLARNKLTSISENLFKDQRSVRYLDLTKNNLMHIAPGAFRGLHNAYKIIVRQNTLLEISGQLLVQVKKLNIFDISDNPTLINLPGNFFENLGDLNDLSLHTCGLYRLPRELFKPLYNVTYLVVSRNNINEIAVDQFSNNTRLSLLDLSENNLSLLPERAFVNQSELEFLMLGNNKLSVIKKDTFVGLVRLNNLNLKTNRLYTIEPHSFDPLFSLVVLNLEDNKLQTLPEDIFNLNKNLQILSLSRNRLTNLIAPTQNANLNKLSFSDNLIESVTLPRKGRWNYELDLSRNRIRYVNVSDVAEIDEFGNSVLLQGNELNCDCNFLEFFEFYRKHEKAFQKETNRNFLKCKAPPDLKDKSLNSISKEAFLCDIKKDCPESCHCYFRKVYRVTTVDCSKRNLKMFPSTVPANVSILFMGRNQISSLQNLSKPEWADLREIYIEGNQIVSEDWVLPPNLEVINLQQNQLTWFPPVLFNLAINNSNFRIRLGMNPWVCNCSLASMHYWLLSQKDKVLDVRDVRCRDTILLDNDRIRPRVTEMDPKRMCPPRDIIKLISIILAILIPGTIILTLLLASIFYYKHKQTVLAFLYIHVYGLFICLFSEDEMDEEKRYDAFICYSHEDRDVAMTLIQELENKDPFYKLCIHERDWIPGNMISSNILTSVRESRRTVLVLSQSFLASPWFLVEFQTAYQHMIAEKVDRIIPVLVGQLPDKTTLEPDLRILLSTKTYLEWNERRFWEKIRYTLPHKKQKKFEPNSSLASGNGE